VRVCFPHKRLDGIDILLPATQITTHLDPEDQALGELVLQVLRGPQALELSIHHNGQSSAQGLTLLHAVGGQDDGLTGFPDAADHIPQLPPGRWIHAGCGLI